LNEQTNKEQDIDEQVEIDQGNGENNHENNNLKRLFT